MSKEARAFQTLMGDLFEAIGSPDSLAFRLYSAAIIDRAKRDDILDYEQSSKKKRALLTAVEAQIQLQPSVYYEFVKILSNDASMDFICRKMSEQCGIDSSQLTTCAPTAKAPPTPSHDHPPSVSGTSSGHAPLASTPSAISSPMDIYKRFLKSTYRCQSMPTYLKPGVSRGAKTYINLALVHRQRETVQKREESVMYQFRGNVDVITKLKTPLDLQDIGWTRRYLIKEQGWIVSPAQQILIEGAPGVGKTTLAWHLCRKWEKGELFQQWSVPVMLQLRDRRIRQAQTLNDLFYHPKPEVRQAVVSQIEAEEGSGVLLIFEGYDELSPRQLSEDSIFIQLLKRKVIPAAAIMVTSRPLATGRLPDEFKWSADLQHIEVVGFRKEDVNDYITAACQGEQDILEAFQSYLSCHPFVYSAMYNPLHCALISQLYIMHWEKGKKEFAPRTLTELYESLTMSFLQRYLSDHPVYSTQSLEFGQFSELPTEVYQQL